jgi:hypothetical protein
MADRIRRIPPAGLEIVTRDHCTHSRSPCRTELFRDLKPTTQRHLFKDVVDVASYRMRG